MSEDTTGFVALLLISEILGIAGIILEYVWLNTYRGGFEFPNTVPLYMFNTHPLFVTLGFVFLYGNGILTYRILRHAEKKTLKIAHTVIMALAFLFAMLSVQPAFDALHFYTVHSWIGVVAFALFAFQWFAGLITYLFPGLDGSIKKSYMPIHISFGILIFLLVCAACLTGIMEKLILTFDDYWSYSIEGLLANCAAACILVFTILVVVMAMKDSYKRQPIPEENLLISDKPPSYQP